MIMNKLFIINLAFHRTGYKSNKSIIYSSFLTLWPPPHHLFLWPNWIKILTTQYKLFPLISLPLNMYSSLHAPPISHKKDTDHLFKNFIKYLFFSLLYCPLNVDYWNCNQEICLIAPYHSNFILCYLSHIKIISWCILSMLLTLFPSQLH